jgi:hypothetical protein
MYSRLLPYSHSNDSWSFSDNDNYLTIGQFKVKIARLNLYIQSSLCVDLLRLLSAGKTIDSINELLNLECPKKLKQQFGTTMLINNSLVYRPVAYLLNRSVYMQKGLSSPHDDAGAFSASITQLDKNVLFCLGDEYDVDLTIFVVKHLNQDTGLEFGGIDTTRFGDLELLVFPTLDDLEQSLFSIEWEDCSPSLSVSFNPIQVPDFNRFQFHLSISNDGQVFHSIIASANCNESGIFEYLFQLSNELRKMTDTTELEIFGFSNAQPNEGILCCRWKQSYIRDITIQSHIVGHDVNSIKFDWLEKTARPAMAKRVRAALTVNQADVGGVSNIGGRKSDPWVPANRAVQALFTQLHPAKSGGQFFQRWGIGDGEG